MPTEYIDIIERAPRSRSYYDDYSYSSSSFYYSSPSYYVSYRRDSYSDRRSSYSNRSSWFSKPSPYSSGSSTHISYGPKQRNTTIFYEPHNEYHSHYHFPSYSRSEGTCSRPAIEYADEEEEERESWYSPPRREVRRPSLMPRRRSSFVDREESRSSKKVRFADMARVRYI